MIIDNVVVEADETIFSKDELKRYVDYTQKNYVQFPEVLREIKVSPCKSGGVDIDYKTHGEKFERIRRICGYLVGTLERWNDSKRAEERERVKHGVEGYE